MKHFAGLDVSSLMSAVNSFERARASAARAVACAGLRTGGGETKGRR